MKKELSINTKPFIRALPQYAFQDSIVNNESTNNNILCCINIEKFTKSDWIFELSDLNARKEKDGVSIYRKGYGARSIGGWYSYQENMEEIVFHIQYQQYTNRWDRITFFIHTQEQFQFFNDSKWLYKISIHCCGDLRIDCNNNMVFYNSNKESKDIPKWYKVSKKQDKIFLYHSMDGIGWTLVYQLEIPELTRQSKLVIGFYINLLNNQYYKLLCNNYIQIKFNKFDAPPVNYLGFMKRDWKNISIHPLIKFSYDKKEMIEYWGLWDYIITNINSKRYLFIWLNEYYIEGTETYQKYEFNHENLIYGYDDVRKSIKMLSIYNGKVRAVEVPFEMVRKGWNNAKNDNLEIKTFEYSPDEGGYSIDVDHICQQIRDYLTGRNGSKDYQYLSEKEEGVFGIDIYNAILNDNDSRNMFLKDVRIAYIIKEHKECMFLRVNYLFEVGIVKKNECEIILKMMEDIKNRASVLLMLVLKNQVETKELLQKRIWEYMHELEQKEKICYGMLLQMLSSDTYSFGTKI